MKTVFRTWLLAACLAAIHASNAPAAEPAKANPLVDPYANETPAQRDARMHWWREARFGMFIHWGVYSVPAGNREGVLITVPVTAPDPISSTVVLQVKGALDVEQMPPMQDAGGAVVLLASEVTLHGNTIQYDGSRRKECLSSWTQPEDSSEWTFKITQPGKFTVTAEISSLKTSSLETVLGDQSQKATVLATGDYAKFKAVKLGVVEIKTPGQASLSLKAVKEGWAPVNVKAVTLKPAE